MKIFVSSLIAEVNTFSPLTATLDTFRKTYLVYDGKHPANVNYWISPITVFRKNAAEYDAEVIEAVSALTTPGGKLTDETFSHFKETILQRLKQCLPVDIVLLNLHGATISESIDDCEGDLLSAIRELVGKQTAIGVELDPHCNFSEKMRKNADILIAYKEYPHTDVEECAQELFDLTLRVQQDKIIPCVSVASVPVINAFPTTAEPMKSFVDRVKHLEKTDPKILSISIIHGFPWSDVSDMGAKIIVTTDNAAAYGIEIAQELAKDFFSLRGKTMPKFYTIPEAIEYIRKTKEPIVIADYADNAGGGAYSDSTFILDAFLREKVEDAVIGCFWEPSAVQHAKSIGVSKIGKFPIGGKGQYSGNQLTIEAKVVNIVENYQQIIHNSTTNMGDTVVLEIAGITLVINANREQTFSTECFTNLGIELNDKKVIVVKSSTHFRASFEKLTDNIISVTTPGTLCPNFASIPYKNVTRPIWPLDNVDMPSKM